jgi:hypothetical protein
MEGYCTITIAITRFYGTSSLHCIGSQLSMTPSSFLAFFVHCQWHHRSLGSMTLLFQLSIDSAIIISLFFFYRRWHHRSLGSMTPLFQLSINNAIDILVP